MTEKRFSVSFENNGCSRCLFLNSSDTGENCKILRSDIQEDEWSNIDYQFERNWRYSGCPLIHQENLNEHKGIIAIRVGNDYSVEDSLNLLEENEQLREDMIFHLHEIGSKHEIEKMEEKYNFDYSEELYKADTKQRIEMGLEPLWRSYYD